MSALPGRKSYYVVGGEYADAGFAAPAAGKTLERHGPFDDKAAFDFWRSITGRTVDNALVRYSIVIETDEDRRLWYVAGGEYGDATFQIMAAGKPLEVYGPFTRQAAMDLWRSITGRTVDNALVRYSVEHQNDLDIRRLLGG
ncbi:MAG: DUF4170 domain-containing protein [Rhodospirillales bacterium]|nr:DUF4170 domain-containing protein [Rhodospirillales bacterium]